MKTRKGGGKKYNPVSTQSVKSKSIRSNKSLKAKYNASIKMRNKRPKLLIKPFTRKLKRFGMNTSDRGLLKSFIICKKFLKLFTKKYDEIMKSGSETKRSNYSLFASILVEKLIPVITEHNNILDLNNNNNNTASVLIKINVLKEPDTFLREFIHLIEKEEIVKEFKESEDEYFGKLSRGNIINNMMLLNNSINSNKNISSNIDNARQEYLEYRSFIENTVNAVIQVINEYASELRTKKGKGTEKNININSLISGFTTIAIKNTINNKTNNTDKELDIIFLNQFTKLGL
jgi:hypothetical protein